MVRLTRSQIETSPLETDRAEERLTRNDETDKIRVRLQQGYWRLTR